MTVMSLETKIQPRLEKEGGSSVTEIRPPRRLRAIGYVRQDLEEMGLKRTSAEGQKARIATCADCHDWHLVHTYEDVGWSGGDLDRPGLLAMLSDLDFEVLVLDRTDRLTCKKKDLTFLLTLLARHGVTCVPATWSWEPLAQYMRWWYRLRANPVYALLDSPPSRDGARSDRARPVAGNAGGAN